MPRPTPAESAPFYHFYISLATGDEVQDVLRQSLPSLEDFLLLINSEKAGYAYAPGKWSLAQLLQHLIDTERVFAYRAMCFARGEEQPLPGFDENRYAAHAAGALRSWHQLVQELILLRRCTIMLFEGLSPVELGRTGIASDHPITVNALGFIMVGHVLHHFQVITERYL
jgi:hypothetical protein